MKNARPTESKPSAFALTSIATIATKQPYGQQEIGLLALLREVVQ